MQLDTQVLTLFLVFCRIGACLIMMPGFSNARVPVGARLYLAVALAFALSPAVEIAKPPSAVAAADLVRMIFAESLAGVVVGLVARLFIEALEFAATAIASFIGLAGLIGSIDGFEPEPALTSLVSVTSVLLLLLTDLPVHLLVGLANSYELLPIGEIPSTARMLERFAGTLGTAFMLALQLSAPFLVYSVLVNVMFAVLGRIVPQVQTYFLSVPFLAIGGLLLLYFTAGEMMRIFLYTASFEISRS